MKSPAAVCRTFGEPLEVVEIDVLAPRANEVLVELAASGVCHTDLTVMRGAVPFPLPIVLGHEGAGVVLSVGDGVTRVQPGDHVVLSWSPQCGTCYWCRRGQAQLCEPGRAAKRAAGMADGTSRFALGGAQVHQLSGLGTFSRVLVVQESAVVPIGTDVPLDVAALIGCGVLTGVGAAINTASIAPGDSVAVVGCGGVGLNTVQGAVLAGAGRVIAIDRSPHKVEIAAQFGATDTVTTDDPEAVLALTQGRGVDVAFEVVGLAETFSYCLAITRPGGQVCVVGMAPVSMSVSLPLAATFTMREMRLLGCNYGSSQVVRDVPKLVDLWHSGQLKLDELVSRRIKLDELGSAIDALESGEAVRTLIVY